MDLKHVAADILSIKHMLNTIGKDEAMKLQLLPIEQELAAITERFQKHFDGNKQDMDSLKSEVEAIKLQLEEMQKVKTNDQNIQNIALEQIEKPLSPTKVKSDADRSKRWSFGDIGEMVDKFKEKVEEKFSKTSSKQGKPKEQVFFEGLKELLETQLDQERLGRQNAISRKRSSTKDSGIFSSSLTNSTSLPPGFSSQSSRMSTSSSDTSLTLEGTQPPPPNTTMVTNASITNQTDDRPVMLSGIKEEVETVSPTAPIPMPERAPSKFMISTPLSPDRDSAFLDNYESLSSRFDGFLSGLLTIVDSYLNQS